MNKFFIPIIIFLLSIFAAGAIFAQGLPVGRTGTNLSDYQYQLDLYRINYAEYQLLKKDFENNPTLNNEQKAVLAAKQAIVSRELALAYFSFVMVDGLKSAEVDYPVVNKAINDMSTIGQFHLSQSREAQKVVTKADITNFTKNYLEQVAKQKDIFAHAQVAGKIASLIHLQQEAKRAYDALLSRLETNMDNLNVQNGIGQIKSYSGQINDQIEALAKRTGEVNLENIDAQQFYDESGLVLSQIRTLQNRLINIIIELDTNYASR